MNFEKKKMTEASAAIFNGMKKVDAELRDKHSDKEELEHLIVSKFRKSKTLSFKRTPSKIKSSVNAELVKSKEKKCLVKAKASSNHYHAGVFYLHSNKP